MIKRILPVLMAIAMLPVTPLTGSAEEVTEYESPETIDEIVETLGLIDSGSLSISTGTKKIHMNMATYGSYTMDEIGFTIIDIERSSNNVNFTHERYADDKITTNSSYYHVGDYAWNVSGGYYYRVKLYHYACSGTTIETMQNISNSVWVG